MKSRFLMALASFALAGSVLAQTTPPTNPTATPRIDQRQVNQQQRIDQGVTSGSLTQTESQRLAARQERMAAAEAKFKADGVVTDKERARLAHKENKNSRAIKRQKHDKQAAKPAVCCQISR